MKSKGIREWLLLSLALGLVAGVASAQMRDVLSVDIPFTFVVEKTTLPAGQYNLKQTNDHPYEWYITDAKGEVKVIFSTEPTEMVNLPESAELVFDDIGDNHFLSKIWFKGEKDGFYVAKSSFEKDLLKEGAKPKMHHVPLHKKQM